MGRQKDTFFAITGSQRPYIYDLPQVLSLPEGFEFRFRYRHKWISNDVCDLIRSNPESLAGKGLVLLFHSQETKRVIPIRRATIVRVEEFGPLVHIRFRVGPFPASHLDIRALAARGSVELQEQSDRWQQAVIELVTGNELLVGQQDFREFDLADPLPPEWHFRRVLTPDAIAWESDPKRGWGALATVLQDEANLSGVPLFYLLGFENEARRLLQPVTVRNLLSIRRASIAGFRLVEGSRYRLRVLTWNGSYPGAAEMRVRGEFDTSVLSLEGAADLVLGRYDVLDYTYLALKPGYTEIAISSEPVVPAGKAKDGSETEIPAAAATPQQAWKSWPAIYLARVPVSVRLSIPRLLATAAIGILGSGLYLISPSLFPAAPGRPTTAVASGLQAIGLFIAFVAAGGITEKLVKVREHVLKIGEKPTTSA